MSQPRRIKVLVVDDSSVMRMMLTRLLGADPELEVVGSAADPYQAREQLVALKPDVMTLDLAMPRMDGLTFLEAVMSHMPIRTVIVSSMTAAGSESALRALELGAIDVVQKPKLDARASLLAMGADLTPRVKAAAKARLPLPRRRPSVATAPATAAAATPPPTPASAPALRRPDRRCTRSILAIASSTGGTEALKVLLKGLPSTPPAIVIVQHMPPVFTKTFAEQLAKLLPFPVAEARDGDALEAGRALLAPGNFHMLLERIGTKCVVRLNQAPLLHGVRPAADHLLASVAKHAGPEAAGIVLTGMGRDGAEGLLAMRRAGAFTIAQDEATSIVYGMPKAAAELGAACRIAPLDEIAELLMLHWGQRAAS
jgi:two-component system chemotaxis response regulator CheB